MSLLIASAETSPQTEPKLLTVFSLIASDNGAISLRLAERFEIVDLFELESPQRIVIDFADPDAIEINTHQEVLPRRIEAPFPELPVVNKIRYSPHKTFHRAVFDLSHKPIDVKKKSESEISIQFQPTAKSDQTEVGTIHPTNDQGSGSEVSATSRIHRSTRLETVPLSITPKFVTIQPPLQPTADLLIQTRVPGVKYAVTLRPVSQSAKSTTEKVKISPTSIDLSQVGSTAESKIRFAYLTRNELDFDEIYAIEVRAMWSENEVILTPGFLSLRPRIEKPKVEWSLTQNSVSLHNHGNLSVWVCLALSSDGDEDECSHAGEGKLIEPGEQQTLTVPTKFTGQLVLIYGDRTDRFALN